MPRSSLLDILVDATILAESPRAPSSVNEIEFNNPFVYVPTIKRQHKGVFVQEEQGRIYNGYTFPGEGITRNTEISTFMPGTFIPIYHNHRHFGIRPENGRNIYDPTLLEQKEMDTTQILFGGEKFDPYDSGILKKKPPEIGQAAVDTRNGNNFVFLVLKKENQQLIGKGYNLESPERILRKVKVAENDKGLYTIDDTAKVSFGFINQENGYAYHPLNDLTTRERLYLHPHPTPLEINSPQQK